MHERVRELSRRAAEEGLLDVAYADVDAPFGKLLVASTAGRAGAGGVRLRARSAGAGGAGRADLAARPGGAGPARSGAPGAGRLLPRPAARVRPADRLVAVGRVPARGPAGLLRHPLRAGADLLRAGGGGPAARGPCARRATPWPETRSRSSCPATGWCAPAAGWAATAAGWTSSAGCWRWRARATASWSWSEVTTRKDCG